MRSLLDFLSFIIVVLIISVGLYLYYNEYLPAIERYDSLLKENRILAGVIEEMKKEEMQKREKVKNEDIITKDRLKNILKTEEFNFTEGEEGILITLDSDEIFKKNSTKFTDSGKTMLKKLGMIVKGMDGGNIVIEVHSDTIRFGGKLKKKFPTSWEFTSLRGSAIARFLQDSTDVDPSLIKIVALGCYHPVETEDTTDIKKANRRIDIKIEPQL